MAAVVAVASSAQTAEYFKCQDVKDYSINLSLDIACLSERLASVHHNSSIDSRVNHCANHPLHIFDLASSQDHVLLVDLLA